MDHPELQQTSGNGVAFYEHLLEHLKLAATDIGTKRSQ